jgi:hypothetical protein
MTRITPTNVKTSLQYHELNWAFDREVNGVARTDHGPNHGTFFIGDEDGVQYIIYKPKSKQPIMIDPGSNIYWGIVEYHRKQF